MLSFLWCKMLVANNQLHKTVGRMYTTIVNEHDCYV